MVPETSYVVNTVVGSGIYFGNIGIFSPIIKKIMMGIPAASAMLATSISFQTVFAGDANEPNFRAKTAEATMFASIGDTFSSPRPRKKM